MKLTKAIEIKEAYHKKFEKHMLSEERFADQISIEALKRIERLRLNVYPAWIELLPSETKE